MRFSAVVFLLLVISSCNEDEDLTSSSCDEAIVCTLDFRSIVVSLRDTDANPIALDSFQVFIKNSNEDITIETSADEMNGFREQGIYPIFNDSFRARYQNREETIIFNGMIDGQQVISREFIVGADCCHVGLIEGELSIILDN